MSLVSRLSRWLAKLERGPLDKRLSVLDQGSLKRTQFMGGDEAVVASARQSTDVDWDEAWRGDGSDEKLIKYMMKHRHGSPFENAVFTFQVEAPLFVANQWVRHRMGSFNFLSGRYSEMARKFHRPTVARQPHAKNKQASVAWNGDDEKANQALAAILNTCEQAFDTYEQLIAMGMAREQARIVLPLATYTRFSWTVNARALMNFLSLRTAVDAQEEIRAYADVVERIFAYKMPITHAAWLANERATP